MALQLGYYKYNGSEDQTIIPLCTYQIFNSDDYVRNWFFIFPDYNPTNTEGGELTATVKSIEAANEYLDTKHVAIVATDNTISFKILFDEGTQYSDIYEGNTSEQPNTPYVYYMRTNGVGEPQLSLGQIERGYVNAFYDEAHGSKTIYTSTVYSTSSGLMPAIDGIRSFKYSNPNTYSYYSFPTAEEADEYLLLDTNQEAEEYARTHASNYNETIPSWGSRIDTSIDWTIYLSSEKLPYIDITWLGGDENNFQYTSLHLAIEPDGGIYEELSPIEVSGEYSYGFNFTSINGMLKNYALIAPTTNRIYCWFEYLKNDGTVGNTSMAYFDVYRGGILSQKNTINNPHGLAVSLDSSTIRIKMGFKEDDEEYEQSHKDRDNTDAINDPLSMIGDIGQPSYSINGIGTRQYACNPTAINQLCSWLWDATPLDDMKLWNTSPIENIVSIQVFPFPIAGSSDEYIRVGNIITSVQASRVSSNFNAVYKLGSGYVEPYFGNFLDYAPFSNYSIYLPFIGIKELDPVIVVGHTIGVYYIIDIITGACKCMIYLEDSGLNKQMIAEYSGQMGIEIPMTGSNRAEITKGYIESGVSMIGNAIAENWAGVAGAMMSGISQQIHTSTSGTFSPSCEAYSPRNIYLIYNRPTYQEISQFNHTHGRCCRLSLNLGNLSGFTQCNEGIDLSGIPCTNMERDMIHSLLVSGIYL